MAGQLATAEEVHLTTRELALRWQCGEQTLVNMRYRDEGPPFLRLNGRMVRYRLADIEAYEESQAHAGGAA